MKIKVSRRLIEIMRNWRRSSKSCD